MLATAEPTLAPEPAPALAEQRRPSTRLSNCDASLTLQAHLAGASAPPEYKARLIYSVRRAGGDLGPIFERRSDADCKAKQSPQPSTTGQFGPYLHAHIFRTPFFFGAESRKASFRRRSGTDANIKSGRRGNHSNCFNTSERPSPSKCCSASYIRTFVN